MTLSQQLGFISKFSLLGNSIMHSSTIFNLVNAYFVRNIF